MADVSMSRRLKAARALAGLTVTGLAKRLDLPDLGAKSLGNVERGQRDLKPQEIQPLVEALGVGGFLIEDALPSPQLDQIEASLTQLHARLDQLTRILTSEDLKLPGIAEILANPKSAPAPPRERRRSERSSR